MPQISVIVPVYKVEQYLCRCVESILSQTFADFELILVDDGSPDNCGAICDEYAKKDSRIVVIHQKNGGLSAARNSGIDWAFANSHSQWLTFIDSDDWVHPDYLRFLLNAAIENNTFVSKCTYMPVSSSTVIPPLSEAPFHVMKMEDGYLTKIASVCAQCKLYHKSAFQEIRFPVGRLHEDLFTTHKLMFQFETIALTDAPLYYYWHNEDSITNRPWTPKRLDEFEAFEEQISFFQQRGLPALKDEMVGRYLCAIGCQFSTVQKNDYPKDVIRLLRKQMRKAIASHAPRSKAWFHQYAWCYGVAYPVRMNIFWRLQSIKKKLKLIK